MCTKYLGHWQSGHLKGGCVSVRKIGNSSGQIDFLEVNNNMATMIWSANDKGIEKNCCRGLQGRSQYEANLGTCLSHFFRFLDNFFRLTP